MFQFKRHYWDNESVVLAVLYVGITTAFYYLSNGVKNYYMTYLLANEAFAGETEAAVKELMELKLKLSWQFDSSVQITVACLFFSIFPFKLVSIHILYYTFFQMVNNLQLIHSFSNHFANVQSTPSKLVYVLEFRELWTTKSQFNLWLIMTVHSVAALTFLAYFICLFLSVRNHIRRNSIYIEMKAIKQ